MHIGRITAAGPSLLLFCLRSHVRRRCGCRARRLRSCVSRTRRLWCISQGVQFPGELTHAGARRVHIGGVFWWEYPNSDCPYEDVNGTHNPGQPISTYIQLCLATPGCEGFNTNGVLKNGLSVVYLCDLLAATTRITSHLTRSLLPQHHRLWSAMQPLPSRVNRSADRVPVHLAAAPGLH